MPTGWWVGLRVNDEDTWQQVLDGRLRSFSIGGRGIRTPVELTPVAVAKARREQLRRSLRA
jgi:hypothetical protein